MGQLWEEIKKFFHTQTWTKVRSSDQSKKYKERREKYVWISIVYEICWWFTHLNWFSSFCSRPSWCCSRWSSKWKSTVSLQWIIELILAQLMRLNLCSSLMKFNWKGASWPLGWIKCPSMWPGSSLECYWIVRISLSLPLPHHTCKILK